MTPIAQALNQAMQNYQAGRIQQAEELCRQILSVDPQCIDALEQRVATHSATNQIRLIPGDANRVIEEVLAAMPTYGPQQKVLAFCFVDPFKLSNLEFETIHKIATRFVDFLVHIPAMDPLRAEATYTSAGNGVLDKFLGRTDWRRDWEHQKSQTAFDVFVADQFSNSMNTLDYKYGGLRDAVMVRSTNKNLPLYRLGFFSRNKLGADFWREARKYSNPQLELFS